MEKNERIFVRSVVCESTLDDWENGEDLTPSSSWDSRRVGLDKAVPYETVDDALKAVCDANGFSYRKENWINIGLDCGDESELSRFDGCLYVDANNAEIPDGDPVFEKWRAGNAKVWSCRIAVALEVRATAREMTKAEALAWKGGAE